MIKTIMCILPVISLEASNKGQIQRLTPVRATSISTMKTGGIKPLAPIAIRTTTCPVQPVAQQAHQPIATQAQLVDSEINSKIAEVNKRYSALESIMALVYNQQFAACPLVRNLSSITALRDKKSITTGIQQYQGEEQYVSFAQTVQQLQKAKAEVKAPVPFSILLHTLAKLRESRLIMHHAPVIKVISETESLRQEVAGLKEQMQAQTAQIAQLLALLKAQPKLA